MAESLPAYLRPDGRGGTLLAVRAAPGARRSAVAGPYGSALRVRIGAPAVDGKANAELILFLARVLGVPRGRLSLVRGYGGRDKTVHIDGIEPSVAAGILREHGG